MAKSDVTLEQVTALIDRVSSELGLLQNPTSGFLKVEGPTNKHRIYVQKSRTLSRIDTTLPLAADDPAYKALSNPNGSISCHVQPTLEQLERCLRMLGDASLAKQVPNKPRPFAVNKPPAARKPKAVAAAVPMDATKPEQLVDGESLKGRLESIRDRARLARINKILENPEKYGTMSFDEAAAIVDGKVDASAHAEAQANQVASELTDVVAEAGIEVVQ
jgi:hypothetical protein